MIVLVMVDGQKVITAFPPALATAIFATGGFAMWIRLRGCLFQVFLKFPREFPQIMPEPGEVAPIVGGFGLGGIRGEHLRGELGGPVCDFVEVAVVGFQIAAFPAGVALTLIRSITERGEERFPFG